MASSSTATAYPSIQVRVVLYGCFLSHAHIVSHITIISHPSFTCLRCVAPPLLPWHYFRNGIVSAQMQQAYEEARQQTAVLHFEVDALQHQV